MKQIWPASAPPQWRAKWIGPALDSSAKENVYFRVRKALTLSSPLRPEDFSAVVHIASESSYRLFVNGTLVGRGPARGTRSLNFFDSYDLAAGLQPGINWIAVEVQSPNVPTFRAAPAVPAVLMQSHDGEFATDSHWQLQPCVDWRSDVPLYNFQTGFIEWHDARRETPGWANGGDDASAWAAASELSENERLAGKRLLPRDVPPMRETVRLPVGPHTRAIVPAFEMSECETDVAVRLTEESHRVETAANPNALVPPPNGDGVSSIYDFGGDANGRFEIDVTAPAGTIFDIGYEEALTGKDGDRLTLNHFTYRFADRYIAREGRQTIGNRFTSRGFRHAQVVARNFDAPITVHGVRAVDELYAFDRSATFHCSDPLLNRIRDACVRTLELCTTDTPVDCPWRENTLYFNDLLVSGVTTLQAFGDPRPIARGYRLAVSQVSAAGLIPAAVPAGRIAGMDWPTSIDRITLPSSNLMLANVLEEYFLYTGDPTLPCDCRDALAGVLKVVAGWADAAGLITPPAKFWNMIDWSYPEGSLDGRCTATLNWMYAGGLLAAARLSERFGWDFNVVHLRRHASHIAAATDTRFWDPNRSAYVEYFDDHDRPALYTQLASATALLSGALPADRVRPASAAVAKDDLFAPELFKHHLILRSQAEYGEGAAALARVRRHWGPIVESGSDTIWEMNVHQHGKRAFQGAGSLCHAFSTTPIDFLQATILGVKPTAAGFSECRIAPSPLGLQFAEGRVPTPHGDLEIAWRKSGSTIALRLVVPAGVKAQLSDGRWVSAGQHSIDQLPIAEGRAK